MSRVLGCASLAALLLVLPGVPAAGPAADERLVRTALRKLLAEAEAPAGLDWPPRIVVETGDRPVARAEVVRTPSGRDVPRITVGLALPRALGGDEDALAFVLGHELGFLLLGHHRLSPEEAAGGRRRQEADVRAAQLVLRAGYSLRRAARVLGRRKEIPAGSWEERLSLVRNDPAVWESSRAFENGVLLLAAEQFEAAEACFGRVVEESPGCHEAWAGLGAACLMQYCDSFPEERLRESGLGHLVCASFYRRGPSVRLRGGKVWWQAVGALREALRLRPDLARARAHLGLAYLVHPEGADPAEAARHLAEAVEASADDRSLDPTSRAALVVNLAVARLAAGEKDAALAGLRAAMASGRPAPALAAAIDYNRAAALAAGTAEDRREALALFEKYLRAADPRSAWWPIAHDRYAELCRAFNRTARGRAEFIKDATERLRRTTAVTLACGQSVAAGELTEGVCERLGPHRVVAVLPGTNLRRYLFARHGVEVLATDEVVAVLLRGPKAPAVRVRRPGGEVVAELRVGMTRGEVGGTSEGAGALVAAGGLVYYRALGVAVRYGGAGPDARAVEVVVLRPPAAGPLGR